MRSLFKHPGEDPGNSTFRVCCIAGEYGIANAQGPDGQIKVENINYQCPDYSLVLCIVVLASVHSKKYHLDYQGAKAESCHYNPLNTLAPARSLVDHCYAVRELI